MNYAYCSAFALALAASLMPNELSAATYAANFTNRLGTIRRELHSSGYSPAFADRAAMTDWCDQDIRELNLAYTRTHDWSLHAAGFPVCDTHFIFPIFAADASDPASYRFGPTDAMLNLARTNLHQKILFRLGTSIEHSEEGHRYNSVMPADYAKYAEICAGVIRHYTRGWANGFNWGDDIVHWEIWNEPDLSSHKCWSGSMTEFNKFFAIVLKRLRDEFGDSVRIGGPAFAEFSTQKASDLLDACDLKGVVPDFISWHYYGVDPTKMTTQAASLRSVLKGRGDLYAGIGMIINEWRYVKDWNESTNRVGIDSAAYTTAVLSQFQNAKDEDKLEAAFHYGSGMTGNYGIVNARGQRNHVFWALYFAGQLFANCTEWCSTYVDGSTTVYMLAGCTADRKTCQMLVSDVLGKATTLSVIVKGLPEGATPTVRRLDKSQLEPKKVTDWTWNGTTLALKKSSGSAVFLVTFTAE